MYFKNNNRNIISEIYAIILLIVLFLSLPNTALSSQLTYLDYDSGKSAPYDDELSYTLSEVQSSRNSGALSGGTSAVIDTWYGDTAEASGNSYSAGSAWTFNLYVHYTKPAKNPSPGIDITVGDTTNGDYFTTPKQTSIALNNPTILTVNYTDASARTLPVGARLYVKITGYNDASGTECTIYVTFGTSTYNSRVDSPFPYKIPTLDSYLFTGLLTFVIIYMLKRGVLQLAPNNRVFPYITGLSKKRLPAIPRFKERLLQLFKRGCRN